MLKKILNWFLSLFKSKYKDSLENFVPKSSVKRGSEVKPKIENKPFIPRVSKTCPECDKPMFQSIGQIVFTHRVCRTRYRRSQRSRYAY